MMDRIEKSATLKSAEILPEEMELINQHTIKELKAEDVFVFKVILCDNEIDRDNEKFTVSALHKLAELYKGKTGIFDHNMRGHDQTARIFATAVLEDETRKTSDGEVYTFIQAKAYIKDAVYRLDEIAGAEVDYDTDRHARTLLKDFCRYLNAHAIEYFEENFKSQLSSLHWNYRVKEVQQNEGN